MTLPKTWPPGRPPRVLGGEDGATTPSHLTQLLRQQGMVVEFASGGLEAVRKVQDGKIDIALLDVAIADLGGLDACRLIKGTARHSFTPVILLTNHDDTDGRVSGLRMGADDYVSKPFDERELLARIHNLLRLKHMHDEASDARAQFENIALTDPLTGLYNYRYLCKRLTEEFKRAERYRDPLACVRMEIDFLDALQNPDLHADLDAIIRLVAERLLTLVREIDVVAHCGGGEFLLVLPSTPFAGAVPVADRIWLSIRATPFTVEDRRHQVTSSLGVAIYPSRDITYSDALLKAAEQACNQARSNGRDRICVYQHQGFIYSPRSPH